ncbi:hypothetical protein LTR82_018227, partial [Friedmanniomyces endolithicus]
LRDHEPSIYGLDLEPKLLLGDWRAVRLQNQARPARCEPAARGWLIPQAVQILPSVIVLCLIWFTPESPRWLVIKNKREKGLQNLNKLRPAKDAQNGSTKAEIDAMEAALQEVGGHDQGKWLDLFKGDMLRRTWIAWSCFVFLQFSGVQFINSYGATFYVNYGLGAKSFSYIAIGNALQIGSCMFQIIMYDFWGRRPFAIMAGLFGFIFLSTIAEVGAHGSLAPTAVNTIVAGVIITQIFTRWSTTNAFVVGAEIGGMKLRKKLMATCGLVNMSAAILITSVLPYLMDVAPGSAGFGSRVGWFFAATDFVLMLFGIFIIPELKGRSLEETDELFNANLKWGWQFKTYQTHGIGAQIAALEPKDGVTEHLEYVV